MFQQLPYIMALGVLALLAIVMFTVILAIIGQFHKETKKQYVFIQGIAKKWGIEIAGILALGGMLGSLFLSEVANLAPCLLCWYQRIALYPIVLLSAIAMWKKEQVSIAKYILGQAIIGMLLSAFHIWEQVNPQPILNCTIDGSGPSCAENYIAYFGFMSIPVMSFVVFTVIALVVWGNSRRK